MQSVKHETEKKETERDKERQAATGGRREKVRGWAREGKKERQTLRKRERDERQRE